MYSGAKVWWSLHWRLWTEKKCSGKPNNWLGSFNRPDQNVIGYFKLNTLCNPVCVNNFWFQCFCDHWTDFVNYDEMTYELVCCKNPENWFANLRSKAPLFRLVMCQLPVYWNHFYLFLWRRMVDLKGESCSLYSNLRADTSARMSEDPTDSRKKKL